MDSEVVRFNRAVLALAGLLYPLWVGVVELLQPDAYDPLWQRSSVGACFLAVLAASFRWAWVRNRIAVLFFACCELLTVHFFFLLSKNSPGVLWIFGSYVVVIALGACFQAQKIMIAYSFTAVALAGLVILRDERLLQTIFLPGLVTMLILTNVSLRGRLKAERARAELVRTEAALRARDEFIAVAGHELKTPLAGLVLLVEALRRQNDADPRVARVVKMVGRLSALIEELLDVSRISTGRVALSPEALDLAELVREIVDRFSDQTAGAQRIAVEAVSVTGRWDRMRLDQAISNLISNAIKYGDGKPIDVRVGAEDDHAIVAVSDHGIGIAQEHRRRIFRRFERAVSDRRYGGLGLGLWITKQIVSSHGGTIDLESELGHGSCFTVTLPCASEAQRPARV